MGDVFFLICTIHATEYALVGINIYRFSSQWRKLFTWPSQQHCRPDGVYKP